MIFTVFIFAYKILTLFSTGLVVFNMSVQFGYTLYAFFFTENSEM